jgi:hypothetical protein
VYLFSTQGLWFTYFQKARYWRLTFGVLILTATFINDVIMWISGFQKDCVSPSWRITYQLPFLHIESFIIFGLVTGVGYLMLSEKNN